MSRAEVVALEYFGGYRVDATRTIADARCDFLLLTHGEKPAPTWQFVAREGRNRSKDDVTDIYRRAPG
jgi:hypothetical protein